MIRRRLHSILIEPAPGDRVARIINALLLALILLNVLAMILETVEAIRQAMPGFFTAFETFSVVVFTLEYLGRLWSCTLSARFPGALRGRLRWATTAMALADLAAILPAYLPFLGVDLRVLRVARALRIVRLAKLGRYSRSMRLIGEVIKDRKPELMTTLFVVTALLLVASTLMYHAEHDAQPVAFGSIPAAMWWAVVTLTTVGYGDVYPITPVGRMLGAVIAILGIGMVALPTGILGAGFVEAVQRRRQARSCPHCGKPIDSTGA